MPVISVEVGVDDVVVAEGGQAGRVAVEVRGADVGGPLPDDGDESVIEGVHLRLNASGREGGEVWVRPRVRTDLMSVRNHAGNDGGLGGVGDRGAPVLAVDEESGLDTTGRQEVEE